MNASTNPRAHDQAPWLTMLHGFWQNAELFGAQKRAFEERYRVICPELLGHGARDVDTPDYSIASHAADVLEQLRAHGIERTHFWGTHTGTSVALYLALQHPTLIASLILEAPVVPGLDMPSVTAQIERARATARTSGVEPATEQWFLDAEWFRVVRESPVACRAAEHYDILRAFRGRPLLAPLPAGPALSLMDRVGQIDCPVLIYNGSNDMDDFLRAAARLAEMLPHAEKVEVPALGGFPAWESPERVDPIVEAFLQKL